jgi:Spy/CpxP family protein refolding chaperone
MIRILALAGVVTAIAVCGQPAGAQEHQHAVTAAAPGAPASSMASLAGYSAEERAQGLREGRGMGLAIPAEGNGYPGPRHVLELAEQLSITADQRRKTEALFNAMKADAQRLGARLLAEEAELNAMFREKRATPALLEETARRIGTTEAALKVTHLRTHLAMMQILRPDQVANYVALRRAGGGTGNTRPGDQAVAQEHTH